MAIAYNDTSVGTQTASSPLTFSHDCGSGDFRFLIVHVSSHQSTPAGYPTISGVTYNGVAMTKVSEYGYSVWGMLSSLWFLHNPASGSNNVSVSFTGLGSGYVQASASSFTGVKPDSTADAQNTFYDTYSSGDQSLNVTTVADNCWVYCGLATNQAQTITALQTSRYSSTVDGKACGGETYGPKTPAGSTSMGFNLESSCTLIMTAASFAPNLGISQTVTAKARIKSTGVIQTVSAKSNIARAVNTPTLYAPTDDTSGMSPVVFQWYILSSNDNKKIHSHIQIDKTSDAFGDIEKEVKSYVGGSGMEYWDGADWQDYPTDGVDRAYIGNLARVSVTLTDGNKWWRVRGGTY